MGATRTITIKEHQQTDFKIQNAFWTLPLGMFLLVSIYPTNALAFERHLPISLASSWHIPIVIDRQEIASAHELPQTRIAASVIAVPTPITRQAYWLIQPTAPVRVASLTVPVLPLAAEKTLQPTPTPAIQSTPAPKTAPPASAPENSGTTILVLEGEASYYSRAGCLGCSPALRMANGQPLNDNALTMAIGANRKHLVGHKARVTSLTTGKSVMVTITDTGGFYKAKYGNRVADLTIATKNAIGMTGGVGQVRVEVF
ncbi:MAG: hypothetical protein ACRD4B_00610 [Acidobacteriota bacterium]